jgi:HAD superfamily hydrolase (TIGR01549 family)
MPQGFLPDSIDAALFDVDGTLIDSLGVIVGGLGDAVDKYCGFRPAREVLLSLIGIPLERQMRMYAASGVGSSRVDDDRIQEMCSFAVERFDALAHEEVAFEAAIDALMTFHAAGIKTALVTSKSAIELDAFLARFRATHAIDTTVCASDVRHPKPAPESAVLACARLGVQPSRAVMIGDSIYDLRCARDAGVRAIAVTYGAAARDVLLSEEPNLFFDTPDDLLRWVQTTVSSPPCPARS